MRGIGIVIMQRDTMIKNDISVLIGRVRNGLVHHRRTWLPYGAILLCLAGIWFCWDDRSTGQEPIREKKNESRSSSPVFSAANGDVQEKKETGTLVYSTAAARQSKPLPDLFAHSLPKKTMAETAPPAATQPQKAARKGETKQVSLPKVCGVVENGGQTLVFLQHDNKTNVYGIGDVLNGYRIVYINTRAVGLQKEDVIIEIPM